MLGTFGGHGTTEHQRAHRDPEHARMGRGASCQVVNSSDRRSIGGSTDTSQARRIFLIIHVAVPPNRDLLLPSFVAVPGILLSLSTSPFLLVGCSCSGLEL